MAGLFGGLDSRGSGGWNREIFLMHFVLRDIIDANRQKGTQADM